MSQEQERIIVAKLLRPHGVRGAINVLPYSDYLERFHDLETVFLENESGKVIRKLEVDRADIRDTKVYLHFRDYPDRTAVEALKGLFISIPREEAVELPQDTWFITDLVGCDVISEREGNIGVVKEVVYNSAQDMLLIAKDGEKDIYLPMIRAFILNVDIAEKRIDVKLPEGLFDLYRASEQTEQ